MFNNLKNFFYDENYVINLYEGYFHVFNYSKIDIIKDDKIVIYIKNFKLLINGKDFKILKLLDHEVLVRGNITDMRFLYE